MYVLTLHVLPRPAWVFSLSPKTLVRLTDDCDELMDVRMCIVVCVSALAMRHTAYCKIEILRLCYFSMSS